MQHQIQRSTFAILSIIALMAGLFFTIAALPASAVTIDELRPEDPTNIRLVKRSARSATIAWDAEPLATHYEVRLYNASGKDIAIIDDVPKNKYKIPSKWLRPNRKYYVRIAAVNEDLGSGIANAPKFYFRTLPQKPQNVKVTAVKSKEVGLRWEKPEGTIRFYRVQVREFTNGTKTEQWRKKVISSADATAYTVTGLKKKRTYKIRVQAGFNNKSKGRYSDWITIQPR